MCAGNEFDTFSVARKSFALSRCDVEEVFAKQSCEQGGWKVGGTAGCMRIILRDTENVRHKRCCEFGLSLMCLFYVQNARGAHESTKVIHKTQNARLKHICLAPFFSP